MAKKAIISENTDRVPVTLPRGTKYAAFVSVNGVAYNIPAKGTHEVPPEIAEELARSQRAEDVRDENSAAMQQATEKARQV